MDLNQPVRQAGLCIECQTGVMGLRLLTYFTWLDGELITVQNFPAWVCDVCGRREYDPQAVNWLNILLDPETGRKNSKTQKPSTSTPIPPGA